MSNSTFDPNSVRYALKSKGGGAGRAPRRPRRTAGRFLRGPVPLAWLMAAARLRTRGLHLALALAYLAGVNKRDHDLKLSYSLLGEFGVDRHAAYRALNDMIAAGLVTVLERLPGRSPVVSLRFEQPTSDGAEVSP